jgi:polar amino acid transport system substrate-binding protein
MRNPIGGRRGLTLSLSALVLVLSLVASACASSSSSSSSAAGGSSSVSVPSPVKDDTIAAEVPADIASAGQLTVATDASYAPNEFVNPSTSQLEGWDIELGQAIGTVMGVKWNFVNAGFDSIIPGLSSGKYGIGMSSFTDTKERQQTVDFVTYYNAGTSFYTAASGGPDVTDLSSLCGLTVGVESGTTQKIDATKQSSKCTAAGQQPVSVQTFPDQNGANLALSSGRVQVVSADSPVADYAVAQSNGQFKIAGQTYGEAPYGIAVPRPAGTPEGQAPMTKPVLDALNKLIQDGTYQAILEKWGVQSGAITTPQINGAIS